jgi:hypothetical protein
MRQTGSLVSENTLAAIRQASIRRNTQRTSLNPGPLPISDRGYAEFPRRRPLSNIINKLYTTSSVYVIQATMLAREEIELAFVAAGWEIAGRSPSHLVTGCASGLPLSIRAYGPCIDGSDEPIFELVDRLLELTYWVGEVPTPRAASALIRKHAAMRHSARSIVTLKSSLWRSIASISPSNSPIRTMPFQNPTSP